MEKNILPEGMVREEILKRFNEFMIEDEEISREFWKVFNNRRAFMRMPIPSVSDCVNAAICYDASNNFDLRMLITLIYPEDRKLFVDVAKFVSERYVNNQQKPASQLTLRQFKADLARRLVQLDF